MNLYKYISSDLWDKILKQKQIRFTQPSIFNDPFEMQPFYESFAEEAKVQETIDEVEAKIILEELLLERYPNLPPEVRNLIPVKVFESLASVVSQFVSGNAPAALDGLTSAIIKGLYIGFNENIGVLSLSEKHNDLLMWAHYAQNHKGLVIGFSSEHKYFHQQLSPLDESRHVRKVHYSQSRPGIRLTTMKDATGIFLTKSEEWKYEHEWRMMRPLLDSTEMKIVNGESIHLFSFPPDCVTEVILGYRMLPELREEILEYLSSDGQYAHVKKYVALLDEREFKLNVVPTEI